MSRSSYHEEIGVTGAQTPIEPIEAANTGVSEGSQIGQNIAAVHEFYAREEQRRSASQRHAESIGSFVGRAAFLVATLLFVSAWIAVNLLLTARHLAAFDPSSNFWLQGIAGLGALLTTTVVLIKQIRVAKLGDQRAHLDLKVTLLIEQKTAKLIDLLEELRRDLPNVTNRHDSGAAVMQQAMNREGVLAALDEKTTSPDGSTFNADRVTAAVPAPEAR